jgi:hypothetical protein
MSSLRELQTLCHRAFLHEDAEPLAAHLVADGVPARVRIEVYQNNARETFRKTLTRTYPVIERLVGDECMRGLAHSYMLTHPSRSGDLQRFGAAFAAFLTHHYGTTEWAYLPEVAALEWAVEEVLLEPENDSTSLARLSGVDPSRFGGLVFAPPTAVRFVSSRYPILSIWSANQPGRKPSVDLAAGAEHVALRRAGSDVTMRRLDTATFAFGRLLSAGATLEAAAMDAGPELELEAALRTLVTGGYLGAPCAVDA